MGGGGGGRKQGTDSLTGSSGTPIAENGAKLCRGCTTTKAVRPSVLRPNLSHFSPTSSAPFAFTLVSADGASFPFSVTADMCANSLYLRTARDVGASEGSVPVGSAQAIRDYVAYLQYSEFRKQLAAELARSTAAAIVATTASPLPAAAPITGVSRADEGARRGGACDACAAVQPSMFPWDEDELGQNGVHGYSVQPLDCDRAYTCHANRLRHWLTSTELASFRGETAFEDPALAGIGDERRGRSPLTATSAPTPSSNAALSLESLPLAMTPVNAPEGTRHQHHSSQRFAATPPLSPPSSTSLSSSVSSASLEAYENAARAVGGPYDRWQRKRLGEELGYGELVALGDPEGLFFIERVLLAYESAPGAASAPTTGSRWPGETAAKDAGGSEEVLAPQSSQSAHSVPAASQKTPGRTAAASSASFRSHPDPNVALTARQQCRLLELISVADFMCTQSLVELCATYLATWLMDSTAEDIVQSFLTTAGSISVVAGAGACSAPTLFQATGAASFNEPWVAPVRREDVVPGKVREATRVSLTSAGASCMSGAGTPHMETVTATSKKRSPAAAAAVGKRVSKQKGSHAASKDANAAEPLGENGEGRATTTITITSSTADGPADASLLLTGDQRLALLRQMKRDNSIMVCPY
ncbi:hypothetical protein LSCM1_02705 [Leishmania martiniquensis]|uniref:Uncharacterized protein n=1 Tax=Leishmania martiniquensis TaxID=1580590 RepID=A0A836GA46_9TRYP|nr:hypothetical protein LSCM1_02705 [Leishmania martiniquensis]